jgi:hypothetical protein
LPNRNPIQAGTVGSWQDDGDLLHEGRLSGTAGHQVPRFPGSGRPSLTDFVAPASERCRAGRLRGSEAQRLPNKNPIQTGIVGSWLDDGDLLHERRLEFSTGVIAAHYIPKLERTPTPFAPQAERQTGPQDLRSLFIERRPNSMPPASRTDRRADRARRRPRQPHSPWWNFAPSISPAGKLHQPAGAPVQRVRQFGSPTAKDVLDPPDS